MFTLHETSHHLLLKSDLLELPGLFAGFTTRKRRTWVNEPWVSDWTFRGQPSLEYSTGYADFVRHLLPEGMSTAIERQVHSTTVTRVVRGEPGNPAFIAEASDALITSDASIVCLSQSADCCVGIVIDEAHRATGVFHAGWRGAVAGMPGTLIARMQQEFGSDPASLLIALGPTIQQRSYQVGPEVAEAVAAIEPEYAYHLCHADPSAEGRYRFNLQGLVHLLLQRAGVPGEQIDLCPHDTFSEPDLLHSYRRDGAGQGLQVGFGGWHPH